MDEQSKISQGVFFPSVIIIYKNFLRISSLHILLLLSKFEKYLSPLSVYEKKFPDILSGNNFKIETIYTCIFTETTVII